jgi:hypothetical protein
MGHRVGLGNTTPNSVDEDVAAHASTKRACELELGKTGCERLGRIGRMGGGRK